MTTQINVPTASMTRSPICCWDRWLRCEYLPKFFNEIERHKFAWGKLIDEENLNWKISWQCPFKKRPAYEDENVFTELLPQHPCLQKIQLCSMWWGEQVGGLEDEYLDTR